MTARELGHTGIHVSPIGLGCMQFSASGMLAGFFSPMAQDEADSIVKTALDGGITTFDTAEMYGRGESERRLAAGLVHAGIKPGEVTVATKWPPVARTARSVSRTIDDRIGSLEPFPIDLHQIHFGFGGLSPVRKQVEAMAQLVAEGKTRAVGVSNFTAKQMCTAHAVLAEHGIPLATNQVQINLLKRDIERNGVLETARRLGVTLIAYSPLRSGMLTGKLHDNHDLVAAMPRFRRTVNGITEKNLDRTKPLIDAMRDIAEAHKASVSQIALASSNDQNLWMVLGEAA
jgi:aryl-alcohol dehydrogenase-like predicted oxidoreductase